MSRILVIEDEPGTQLLLRSRLNDLDHEVVVTSTGAEGLVEAREGSFDLFLVDVRLGSGIDGYEVCRRLKRIPEISRIPVVLISAFVRNRQDLHRGYEAGCESFLIKGDMSLLEDVVRAMLRIKSLQDDLALQYQLLEKQNEKLQTDETEERTTPGGEGDQARSSVRTVGAPDALLVVDLDGHVRLADRRSRDLFGRSLDGDHLGRIAPGTGLEAFVRDARNDSRQGFRFELPESSGRGARSLMASVVPLVGNPGGSQESGLRVLLIHKSGSLSEAAQEAAMREMGVLFEAARSTYHPSQVIGSSPAIGQIRERVSRLAFEAQPVLLRGPVGTGKRFLARVLHFSGLRSGPFVPLDCGGLSAERLETELLGGEEGASALDQARHGTLFLNQIERMPQTLQERLVQSLAGDGARLRSVRLVGATTESAERMTLVPALLQHFGREIIDLPTLAERRTDVPALVRHFLERFGSDRGVEELEDDAWWSLEAYQWPENVRELELAIERACSGTRSGILTVADLPPAIQEVHRRLSAGGQLPSHPPLSQAVAGTHSPQAETSTPGEAPPAPDLRWPDADELSFDYYEELALRHALYATQGDKLAAAAILRVGKSTLYRKLKRFGL